MRKFNITDFCVLIVALALQLSTMKYYYSLPRLWSPMIDLSSGIFAVEYFANPAVPVLAVCTAAILALRFRGPRPSLRFLGRQPGFAACVCAILVVSARLAFSQAAWQAGTRLGLLPSVDWPDRLFIEFPGIATGGGFAIMSAWAIAARGRLFRPSADWVERAGRIIGCLWIACAFYYSSVYATHWK